MIVDQPHSPPWTRLPTVCITKFMPIQQIVVQPRELTARFSIQFHAHIPGIFIVVAVVVAFAAAAAETIFLIQPLRDGIADPHFEHNELSVKSERLSKHAGEQNLAITVAAEVGMGGDGADVGFAFDFP